MKRDMLALKQKLMQRFLDGAITQETYDRMLQDIEQMEVEDAQLEDEAANEGASGQIVPYGQGGAFSYDAGAALPGQPPVFRASPMDGVPRSMGGTIQPMDLPPQGMNDQGNAGSMTTIDATSSRGGNFFSVNGVSGAEYMSQLHGEMARMPSPEIPDAVLDSMTPGSALDIHWMYPLTRECAIAWQCVGVPVRLSLNMNKYVTDETVRVLADIPNLQRLNLTSTAVTDEGLRRLDSLERLESLVLVSTHVCGDAFVEMENLSMLRELVLTSSDFGDEGMERVGKMKLLEELRPDGTAVTDKGLEALAGLSHLKLLNLQGALIANVGLESLAELTELLELYLGGTIYYKNQVYESPISDEGMPCLEKLTELRILHLNDTQVTDAGIASLKPLQEIRELNLADTYITDGCLATLSQLPHLRHVLVDNTGVTLSAIRRHFAHRRRQIFTGYRTGAWDSLRNFLKTPWDKDN